MSRSFGPIDGIGRQLWRAVRSDVRRVRLLLFDSFGEVVLARKTPSQWESFSLPGGDIRAGETPAQAAIREARDTLGYNISAPVFVAEYRDETDAEGGVIYVFRAIIDQLPRVDGVNIAQAKLFPVERLPVAMAPASRRRIDEHLRRRVPDGEW